tara:strand:- start:1541 stop:2164 length:624 start_codon:yes stop_codon:yes gene_type:complete
MSSLRWSLIASILALFSGVITLQVATDGWQVWTAESARRLAVVNNPIQLPNLSIKGVNHDLQNLSLSSADDDSLVLMEFIFTRCTTICQLMGAEFAVLQNTLKSSDRYQNVRLVSVSFDIRDDRHTMISYGARYRADDNYWLLGIPQDRDELTAIMKTLGAIVIPVRKLGFIHNAAVYAIHQGKVVAILDHDDREGVNRVIEQYIDA